MQNIIAVAKRDNNPKRNYLVLNRLQAKHLPASPKKAREYFGKLAQKVKKAYAGEELLLIGFAETATGIGAALAAELGSAYMQTTREKMAEVEFLCFAEAHSHAVEQRLVKEDFNLQIERISRIVFVEDELTTGNTIFNLVRLIRKTYSKPVKFTAASLLNGMEQADLDRFVREEISLLFLEKVDYGDFPARAAQAKGNGENFPPYPAPPKENQGLRYWEAYGCINARRVTDGTSYQKACDGLWEQFCAANAPIRGKRLLVLGTEEFMYPALWLGSRLEEENQVISHSTTRSPILPSSEPDYPIRSRFALVSLYEEGRKTFIYNLGQYDQVIIVTDSPVLCREGVNTLIQALTYCGNREIQLIRWR